MLRFKKTVFRTIHTDYLRFAVISLRECTQANNASSNQPYANRHAIDTIRCSYDCLEAAIEYIHFAGTQSQLSFPIPDTWLTRYLSRKWVDLPLSDRIGCMCFAWTGSSFWTNDQQLQLFHDLKRLRDGLTHSKPTGTQTESVFFDDGTAPSREVKLLPTGLLVSSKPIAKFAPTPGQLSKSDAEQALEILLYHLNRIQDVFDVTQVTLFCFHEDESNKLVSTRELLRTLNCRFSNYWPQIST